MQPVLFLNCNECVFFLELSDVDNSGIRAIEDLNNGVVGDVDGLVTGTSSKASDDEAPLLALFEGTHSLLTTDSRKRQCLYAIVFI